MCTNQCKPIVTCQPHGTTRSLPSGCTRATPFFSSGQNTKTQQTQQKITGARAPPADCEQLSSSALGFSCSTCRPYCTLASQRAAKDISLRKYIILLPLSKFRPSSPAKNRVVSHTLKFVKGNQFVWWPQKRGAGMRVRWLTGTAVAVLVGVLPAAIGAGNLMLGSALPFGKVCPNVELHF